MSDLSEQTLRQEQMFRGRVVGLRVDRVRLPDGREATREVVEHRGAVAIVALDANGEVLLVRQYRTPAGRALLEIPAGSLEEGEDPLPCAQRELQEETGYAADTFEPLASFYSAPGFCTEVIHLYRAIGLHLRPRTADEDENIKVERVPFAQALELVRQGEICDAKSIIGLLLVGRY